MTIAKKQLPRAFISLHIICFLTGGDRSLFAALPSRTRKLHRAVGEERDGGDEAASRGEARRGLSGLIQRGEAATSTRLSCRG